MWSDEEIKKSFLLSLDLCDLYREWLTKRGKENGRDTLVDSPLNMLSFLTHFGLVKQDAICESKIEEMRKELLNETNQI